MKCTLCETEHSSLWVVDVLMDETEQTIEVCTDCLFTMPSRPISPYVTATDQEEAT